MKQDTYDSQTESPSYFNGWSDNQKTGWENQCQAYWPMKTMNTPGKWTCQYGEKIEDDIARGYLKQIGVASSKAESAKSVLKSNKMIDNYFAIIDNSVWIISGGSSINVITSKGGYQPNCTEQNNRKIELYVINQAFFDMLNRCKVVNDKINQVNDNRNVLQNAVVGTIRENFTTAQVLKGQNEITSNLANDYNKNAELYNYQLDVLGNNEKLVNTQNNKLNKQLDEMTAIQEQIALKDRVIELNDELYRKQMRNKKMLIGFFVLLPFLGIPLLLMIIKIFSPIMGISLGGLMILGYIIYVMVISNKSEVRKFAREDKRIISKYENAIANYWNKEKETLSKSLTEFVNENCANQDSKQKEPEWIGGSGSGSGSGSSKNAAYPKGDYIMKSNGPFYYYDGSAPPQQIYPGAVGSIDYNIEGENYKFPKQKQSILNNIKNPITKFFFTTWVTILEQNGVNINDPRFAQDLDIIDFPDSDQTPMPFWDNIKLPIVTNLDQQFNYLFQSYSGEKKNLSKTASVLLVDLWNFIFGDRIPGDVYESWINKLANVLKETDPNVEQFYENYLVEIMRIRKFQDKYGEGNAGKLKFVEYKMIDFIKTFNQDLNVSTPFAKKMVA